MYITNRILIGSGYGSSAYPGSDGSVLITVRRSDHTHAAQLSFIFEGTGVELVTGSLMKAFTRFTCDSIGN